MENFQILLKIVQQNFSCLIVLSWYNVTIAVIKMNEFEKILNGAWRWKANLHLQNSKGNIKSIHSPNGAQNTQRLFPKSRIKLFEIISTIQAHSLWITTRLNTK